MAGVAVSDDFAVAPIVWNVVPADAPSDWPAFCTWLRNVFRSPRSTQPDEEVHVVLRRRQRRQVGAIDGFPADVVARRCQRANLWPRHELRRRSAGHCATVDIEGGTEPFSAAVPVGNRMCTECRYGCRMSETPRST